MASANHGRVDKYDHEFEGRNSRMDGLQAAVLATKLRHLDDWIQRRNEIAQVYSVELTGLDEIKTPIVRPDVRHVFHLYVVRCEARDELAKYLADETHVVRVGVGSALLVMSARSAFTLTSISPPARVGWW